MILIRKAAGTLDPVTPHLPEVLMDQTTGSHSADILLGKAEQLKHNEPPTVLTNSTL